MKCFYHPEQDAVGMCPQCGKAACRDCLKEVDGGILCKGCIAQRLQAVEAQNKAVLQDRQTTIIARLREKRFLRNRLTWFVLNLPHNLMLLSCVSQRLKVCASGQNKTT